MNYRVFITGAWFADSHDSGAVDVAPGEPANGELICRVVSCYENRAGAGGSGSVHFYCRSRLMPVYVGRLFYPDIKVPRIRESHY